MCDTLGNSKKLASGVHAPPEWKKKQALELTSCFLIGIIVLTLNRLNVGTILAFEEGKKHGVPQ